MCCILVGEWLKNATTLIIFLFSECESIWIWNLGRLSCVHPDRWHTVLLEIDFMMNKMCSERSNYNLVCFFLGSDAYSKCKVDAVLWVWCLISVTRWALNFWLELLSSWPSSALGNEYGRGEVLIYKNRAWKSCREMNFKWCQRHCAFAFGQ